MPTLHPPTRCIGQLELAKLANVSQKTVSRALGGEAGVSPRTRERIRALAAKHLYRPNVAARSTRSGRFGAVALLLGTHRGPSTHIGRSDLPPALLNGIQDVLAEQKLNLMVVKLDDAELTNPDHVPDILREANSDGLLIDYTHGFPPRMERLVDDFGIPAVWLNTKRRQNAVYPEDFHAGRQATEHLIGLGHTRIAYIDYTHGPEHPSEHYSVAERRAGYVAAMATAGLEPRPFQVPGGVNVPRTQRVRVSADLLAHDRRPTAVVAYGDTTTIPVYIAALQAGLSVPDDLSIVQFGNEVPRTLAPAVSTMLTPLESVGRQAVAMLEERISMKRDLPAVAVPFSFASGSTTAARPGGLSTTHQEDSP